VVDHELRVVLIDDDDALVELLRANFDLDLRFKLVARGRNGSEALDLLRLHEPDAVLMDLHMPVLGGVAATRALLAEDPSVCVIAFTASNDPRELQAVRDAGAFAVLKKPFDPVAFLDAFAAHAASCSARADAA
jgi:CheY-like chemotaxis protein